MKNETSKNEQKILPPELSARSNKNTSEKPTTRNPTRRVPIITILAYRQKTNCKQYAFSNLEEAFKFFRKKCYWMELIIFYQYDPVTHRQVNQFVHRNNWS